MSTFGRSLTKQVKGFVRTVTPRAIRRHRIMSGPLRGQFIVTSWHDYPRAILGRIEPQLLTWFEENVKPGTTWLDIGASYGYTALSLAKQVGSKGRVVAFEPVFSTAGALEQTMSLNGHTHVLVAPFALLDVSEVTVVHAMRANGMADSAVAEGEGGSPMYAASLDWLWPRLCGTHPRIDGMKIDVQGMEIETLRGMRGILREYKPILVVEVHAGVSRDTFAATLASMGYMADKTPIEGTAPAEAVRDELTFVCRPMGT